MTSERFRITDDASVYFVTYSIVEWLPVFVSERACKTITDSLSYCHQDKRLRINAFVIMPTHLHAIVFDAEFDNQRLQQSLADFRKFTGRSLSDHCCSSRLPWCFAQTLKSSSTADRKRRFWQSSRHPVGLHTENFWKQKIDYLHENPVRKGLVTRAACWRFSSAAYYQSDGKEHCDVTLSAIDWT